MGLRMVRYGFVGAVLALTACAEITGSGAAGNQQTSLRLLDGTVVATGPLGYCVEKQTSRASSGFAVLASCDALAGQTSRPALNGFATVQVGATGTGLSTADASALTDILGSSDGRAFLSRSGTAGDIRVLERDTVSNAVTVHFSDAAAPPVPGLQSVEWRGFFTIKGRLTTVAVRGLAQAPLGTDDGQTLLIDVIKAMQASNATTAVTSES